MGSVGCNGKKSAGHVKALLLFVMLYFPIQATAGTATADSLMSFAGNIHQFNSIYPQEKVYLQFDNTSYYCGETIWFKAFVVSASDLQRAQSKVLYVDLISPSGVLLVQQKLKIVAGQADGALPLIDGSTAQAREKRGIMNYPSGFYEIRAYTAFMQNFGDEYVFSRVLAVYDRPKNDGAYYEESPVVRMVIPDLAQARPKVEKQNKVNMTFHPEGGHLILGKPCRVAFKVTDENGLGTDANGVLDDSEVSFSTLHDGMGCFEFTPTALRNTVEIQVGNTTRSFSLPKAEESGLAMRISQSQGDSLLVSVDPTVEFLGMTLGLTVTCRGELMDFCTIETADGKLDKSIPMSGIPEGVCHVCLFDKEGTVYASRHFYHSSKTVAVPVLTISPDKEKYNPFEKVSLNLELKDGQGKPFRDRFCLSVRDSRGQGSVLDGDLRTSMLLSSDIKGYIERPSWYFDSEEDCRADALDLLMLVQGWERYDWQTMTGHKEFSEVHRREESLTLNGWILSPSGKKTMEGVRVLAAMMPDDKSLSETYEYLTDSTGYFGFDIGPEFFGKAKFSIDTRVDRERLIGTSARIRFDRSMLPGIRPYNPAELVFEPLLQGDKTQKVKETGKNSTDGGLPTVVDENKGILLPDVDIEEERMYIDYFTFNAFDVVKDVEVDLDKGEYTTDLMGYLIDKGFQVLCDDNGQIESINGFAPFFYVHNSNKYLNTGIFENPSSIDSKDITSIIVFDRPMYMLNILTQCPLYVDYQSKTLNIMNPEQYYVRRVLVDVLVKEEHKLSTRKELYKINKRLTTVDGYSKNYSFYAPEYPDGPVMGDVDYRRTLYWNPNVVTDSIGKAQVEFYNSSITKHFNVSAAGMTSSGIPYVFDNNF